MAYLGNRLFICVVALCAPFFWCAKAHYFGTPCAGHRAYASLCAERTLIACAAPRESFLWTLFCTQGYALTDLDDHAQKTTLTAAHLFISSDHDVLFFNSKKLSKKRLLITSVSAPLCVNGRTVAGPLLFVRDEQGCSLVSYGKHLSPIHRAAYRLLAKKMIPFSHVEQWPAHTLSSNLVQEQSQCADKKNMHRIARAEQEPTTADRIVSKSVELEQLEILEKQKTVPTVPSERQHLVRVLLDEQAAGHSWHLRMPGGFFLTQERHGNKKVSTQQEIDVSVYGSTIYINGHVLRGANCLIAPVNTIFYFNGAQYQGSVFITRERTGRWLLINCLDLEAYTAAVLGSESWPGWPLEVNKVLAIVSRTYALAMIMNARAAKRPYHIKNTNQHQTYRGVHTNPVLMQAVAQTKGVFIAYKRRPIIAMFDACCGGVITAYRSGIDFVSAPYLAREYACTFCRACKIYSWQAYYSLSALEKMLVDELGGGARGLQDIRVYKKDRAGLVRSLLVKSRRGTIVISGKKIYSLLKKVKSFCYTVRKEGHTIVFRGRGYGHHVGLCQWGAREMVRQGYTYPEIINFYYPGTSLVRLP